MYGVLQRIRLDGIELATRNNGQQPRKRTSWQQKRDHAAGHRESADAEMPNLAGAVEVEAEQDEATDAGRDNGQQSCTDGHQTGRAETENTCTAEMSRNPTSGM